MKRILTIFLQTVIVFIGIATLVFMLWEPHLEGRNAHATFFDIYFEDPFLAYVYLASVSFFGALYQAFVLLGYIGKNETVSPDSVRALRTMKYCAMSLAGFVMGAEAYFFIVRRSEDDIAGGVAVGLSILLVASVIAVVAAVFENRLQSAVEMKSENGSAV